MNSRSPGYRQHYRHQLITLIFFLPAIAGCSAVSNTSYVGAEDPQAVSEVAASDLSVLLVLLSREELRNLRQSPDADSWVDGFWTKLDPTPATSENELRDVLTQRAAFLQREFPGRELSELQEPWGAFLQLGPWDSASSEDRDPGGGSGTYWLAYSIPTRRNIQVGGRATFKRIEPPALGSSWTCLVDSSAHRNERIRALRRIIWYETPATAELLLQLPYELIAPLQPEWNSLLGTLAVRLSYIGGRSTARRIAALLAAKEPPRFVLERIAVGQYDQRTFLRDLNRSHIVLMNEAGIQIPQPHPELWSNPIPFLEDLASSFPKLESLTGWDWRGDLYLEMGPPAFVDRDNRTATYLYGEPRVLQVTPNGTGHLQAKEFDSPLSGLRLQDPLGGTGFLSDEIRESVNGLLFHSPRMGINNKILDGIRRMTNSHSYSIGFRKGGHTFPLYISASVFPEVAEGEASVVLSLGVSVKDVANEVERGMLKTGLQTSCLFLDKNLRGERRLWHAGRFQFQPTGSKSHLPFIVDTFTFTEKQGTHFYYLSALDPVSERSSGYLQEVQVANGLTFALPSLSSLMLAAAISESPETQGLVRSGLHITPYPSRQLYYDEPIWVYFEIDGLKQSSVGDYTWEESYLIVPDSETAGVIRLQGIGKQSSIKSRIGRYFQIDLESLQASYEGDVYLIVGIRDAETGLITFAASRLNVASR